MCVLLWRRIKMKWNAFKSCLLVLLLTLFFLLTDAIAVTYTVRTIYFTPADKVSAPIPFKQLMKDVQNVYRSEMIKHGFGDKTFKLETDATGDVVIHQINGKFNAVHYETNTIANTFAELPIQLRLNHNVHVIVFAGMNRLEDNVAFAGPLFGGEKGDGSYGGFAFIAEDIGHHPMSGVIEHELGHTFGLWHNFKQDGQSYFMGPGDDVLHEFEARWLSKSHYFNEHHVFNFAPTIEVKPLESVGDNLIKITMDIEDADGLHQVLLVLSKQLRSETYDWKYLDGNRETVEIRVSRATLEQTNFFRIYPKDDFGNYRSYEHYYVLPEPKPTIVWNKNPDLNKNPDIDKDSEEEQEDTPIRDVIPEQVKANNRMLISWASVKRRR